MITIYHHLNHTMTHEYVTSATDYVKQGFGPRVAESTKLRITAVDHVFVYEFKITFGPVLVCCLEGCDTCWTQQ